MKDRIKGSSGATSAMVVDAAGAQLRASNRPASTRPGVSALFDAEKELRWAAMIYADSERHIGEPHEDREKNRLRLRNAATAYAMIVTRIEAP